VSFNHVTLMGNLTRDPELKYLANGTAVCSFSLALNESWKDDQGEKQEHVSYIDCEAWNKIAETLGEYLRKGRAVLVSGSLRQQRWQDKETDQNRSKVVVRVHIFQFVGPKPKADEPEGGELAESHEAPPF